MPRYDDLSDEQLKAIRRFIEEADSSRCEPGRDSMPCAL